MHPTKAEVATSSEDGTAKIWDVETGTVRLNLDAGPYARLSYSPDGRYLAVGGAGGGQVFMLDESELISEAQSRLTRWWTEAECLQYLHTSSCPTPPSDLAS